MAVLSLDDVMKLPLDPDRLAKMGLIAPEPVTPPIVAPAKVTANLSPVASHEAVPTGGAVKPMTPVTAAPPTGKSAADVSEIKLTPPGFEPTPDALARTVAPTPGPLPELTSKEKVALPVSSPGVPFGSSEYYRSRLEQMAEQANAPHHGIGKLGHILGRIGNIALTVAAPGAATLIPGTDLNKIATAGHLENEMARQQEIENTQKHEENTSAANEEKIDQAERKIDELERKHLSDREIALRKQGLKPNPEDPNGTPVPLTRDDMSETERSVLDLKTAQAEATQAKKLLDQLKADPDSPQNQAIRDRLKIMAQNAATAAGKLGLDKKKFLADYFGTDENGEPLSGVQVTPEGKPIGPKVAGSSQRALSEFNKNYEVPANTTEKSYQMFEDAYKDHKAGKDDTGAPGMLALSQHLQTTFGTVKGARVTKDMIHEHLHARGVTDDMEVAVNKLINGDPLSDKQWDAFHQLIGDSRLKSWQTAVKEAHRARLPIDFLPEDLGHLEREDTTVHAPANAPSEKKKPLPF